MGKIVNKRELSEILGVSEQTLTDWQRIDMPIALDADRGHANSYDTEAVIKWQIERALNRSRETGKERLDRVNADLRELDLKQRRSEVVEVAEVVNAWGPMFVALRTRLLAIPTGADIPETLREQLAERVRLALHELSQHDPRTIAAAD